MKNIKHFRSREEMMRCLPKNAVVAEIGVARGDFSQIILENSFPKKLYLIDIWEYKRKSVYPEVTKSSTDGAERQCHNYKQVREKFNSQIKKGQVILARGDSTRVLKEFPDQYFDWVYIDANHDYTFVKKDLELCEKKVKKGGLICGHDYCEGNPELGIKYGVIRAVNEFCQKHNWKIVGLADDFWKSSNFRSYALARSDNYEAFFKKCDFSLLQNLVRPLFRFEAFRAIFSNIK